MSKLKRFIKSCPLAVCILCSWAIVAAAEHLPPDAKEIPAGERDEQEDEGWIDGETQEITAYDTLSGVIAANRAPDLSEQAIIDSDRPMADEALTGGGAETVGSQENAGDAAQTDGSKADDGEVAQTDGSQADDGDAAQTGSDIAAGNETDGEGVVVSGEKPQKIKPEYISYKKKKTDSPWYTDPGKIPLTTEYDYQKVKEDYFDDAVFIGDSRIVGMNDYSGLTNATFFAKTGLTVYNLLEDEFVKDPDSGKMVSVSYMMQHHTYGKIYLMVGINELGTGGTQRFADAYRDVLKKFRKWQPDAVIYVQSIMGVSPKKDQKDPVFNNTNIRDKNYAISKLTDGIHIFYLNIQEIYEDKNHDLAQELTFDDVHLYAQHYDKWVDYLKTHAVVRGE